MKPAFCIFHHCPDKQPAWYDGDSKLPITYETERAAELEIVDDLEIKIEQFKAGNEGRDFADLEIQDWVEPDNGHVHTEDGETFGKQET